MAYSPMMKQYFDIKEQYSDCLLFYRLGDFYEMFFDDAKTASRELELTLTGRDCGDGERAPMCGVPYHSCEGYISRLIAKGYKVAVCEQTSDPATSKGLVTREISRVVTPGTVTDTGYLDEKKNNFIAALATVGDSAAAVFADVTTGDIHLFEPHGKLAAELKNELAKFSPAEVVCDKEPPLAVSHFIKEQLRCMVTLRDADSFERDRATALIEKHFGKTIGELKVNVNAASVPALGGLLDYLYATQLNGLAHLDRLVVYSSTRYMELNLVTRRNLELCETMLDKKKHGTLLWVLDRTRTAMGGRLMRAWIEQPLSDAVLINRRLDAVDALKSSFQGRSAIAESLSRVRDVERLMGKVVYNTAGGRELLGLADALAQIPDIKSVLSGIGSEYIAQINAQLDPLTELCALVRSAVDDNCPISVREGGLIKAGFNEEVDKLHSLLTDSHDVLERLEQTEREKTGIRTLRIGYNRVFGYYIEVSKTFVSQVPEHYIRRQTLANGERYITGELKELESSILGASDRTCALEYELFCDLRKQVYARLEPIQRNAAALSQLDVLLSFAEVAEKNGYCKPVVDGSKVIDISAGRHPVVERLLSNDMFVPNDTLLDCADNRLNIITGPNMAGKSTYMRQIALIALMAQMGSYVPATTAHIGIVDKIFTRVGASDDLATGRSTFMLEMSEVAEILQSATERSLIIYDEIGRGTSTFDGMAIARAVLEHTAGQIRARTVFATHYHELTALEGEVDGVKNYQTAVKKRGDDIIFLRRITSGRSSDSYGIEVAKLAGLPDEIIANAKRILASIEKYKQPETSGPGARDLERMSLAGSLPYELFDLLLTTDVEVLTPIECMNLLYKLVKKASGQPDEPNEGAVDNGQNSRT